MILQEMINKHSRKPAAVVLLATVVAGGWYLVATGGSAKATDGPTLADLELAIARADAPPEVWAQYAQHLRAEKRFAHAAMAYERVLARDPYDVEANLQCGTSLAQAGDAAAYAEFVRKLILFNPRLAVDLLARPESRPYLGTDPFPNLVKEARIQAMD